ncbi:MAG: FHA domain-containing protein [Deltaproteobacteria bacterium]|nr:FHA domain-containing protein [Deltaproteobacteria bacterium]
MAEFLEDVQRRAERLGLEAFCARHPDPFLVRLDERGGRDDATPWVFAKPGAAKAPPGRLLQPVAGFMARVFEVVKTSGSGARHVVALGRAADNDIVIEERSISKAHARLKRTAAGEWEVEDAGSRNGTRVNGTRVALDTARALRSGDVVNFGDVSCLFISSRDLFEQLPTLTG